jgi:hypothetical protein
MDLGFSVDLRDSEGDVYSECILVHVGDSTIIKFETYSELIAFSARFRGMLAEVRENLPIERRDAESPTTAQNKQIPKCHCCGSENVIIECGACHEKRMFGSWSAQ